MMDPKGVDSIDVMLQDPLIIDLRGGLPPEHVDDHVLVSDRGRGGVGKHVIDIEGQAVPLGVILGDPSLCKLPPPMDDRAVSRPERADDYGLDLSGKGRKSVNGRGEVQSGGEAVGGETKPQVLHKGGAVGTAISSLNPADPDPKIAHRGTDVAYLYLFGAVIAWL